MTLKPLGQPAQRIPMTGLASLRRGLVLGTVSALLVIAASLVRFPPQEGSPLGDVLLALVLAAVVGGLGLAGWRAARAPSPGLGLGLVLGGLWVAYILVTHLWVGDVDKA